MINKKNQKHVSGIFRRILTYSFIITVALIETREKTKRNLPILLPFLASSLLPRQFFDRKTLVTTTKL